MNQFQKQRLHRLISQHFGSGAVPRLLEALWADGATVAAYYPNAADGRLRLAATKEKATEGADALVICTEWKRFMPRNFEQLAKSLRQQLIFDGRNLYDPARLAELGWTDDGIGRGGGPCARRFEWGA